jgi:NADPH:quinone reductase-like Zn-dependent oxidoreductase
VQIAKHLGAEVTAVSSRRSFDLVRSLGADHVIDREAEDFTKNGRRYDVIFDTPGATSFSAARDSLTAQGRYLTLVISVGVLWHVVTTSMTSGPRVKLTAAFPDHDDMEELRRLVEQGAVRPTVGPRFPLERITEAHLAAEARKDHGSVIVTCGA